MAQVSSISSNATGLKIAEESTPGVLLGTSADLFQVMEPNSYADFGPEIGTTPRNPINPSRQRKKGVTTSLSATGGFNTDLTQTNLQSILQGFLYADHRTKDELAVTTVNTGGATDDFEPLAGGDGFIAGDLLFAKGFDDAPNNGLHVVSGTPTATEIIVTTTLTVATTQAGIISKVGHQAGAGDIDVDASGTLPTLTSTSFDFTTLGLSGGEYIFLGSDETDTSFLTAANNGPKRVRGVPTANVLTIDKSDLTMVTEASTAETIRIYICRALKNEADPVLQVTRTYTIERTLGAPDDASPAQVQADGLIGAYPNELTLNLPPEDKVTLDLGFVALDGLSVDGPTALPSAAGTLVPIVEASAFNTSSDFSRIRLATAGSTDEAPTPLFAFVEEITLTINNNVTANPALSVLGAAVITIGTFEVGGSLTAYYQNQTAADAVRNNDNLTLDFALVKENAGIFFDIPLITLGDGRPTVELDTPVKLPLGSEAATGALIDPSLDHTLMICFFDYLPLAAE